MRFGKLRDRGVLRVTPDKPGELVQIPVMEFLLPGEAVIKPGKVPSGSSSDSGNFSIADTRDRPAGSAAAARQLFEGKKTLQRVIVVAESDLQTRPFRQQAVFQLPAQAIRLVNGKLQQGFIFEDETQYTPNAALILTSWLWICGLRWSRKNVAAQRSRFSLICAARRGVSGRTEVKS